MGPDFSSFLGAIDFGTTTTAILAVVALVVAPVLAYKGGKMVVSALRGADDPYDGSGASGLDFRDLL